jgi:hypothetical protein
MKTSLAQKLPFLQYPDDGILAVLGCNRDLYATLLNEEYRVSESALEKDILIVPIIFRAGPYLCK